MTAAKELRYKRALLGVPGDRPGWYKWWASRRELDLIVEALGLPMEEYERHIEKRDGLYCIYTGIAAKESIRKRLSKHLNNTTNRCSTLRRSIAAILAVKGQHGTDAINDFIDKLQVEYEPLKDFAPSDRAKEELRKIEKEILKHNLYLLNIQDNDFAYAGPAKKR